MSRQARSPLSRAAALACALVGLAHPAFAQAEWTYRARVSVEGTAARMNASSPLTPANGTGWDGAGLFVGSVDSSWDSGGRLRLAGGAMATGSGSPGVRAREAYARVSATSWLDLEAGRRLVRWGVGYGFSPTGVLDPPRVATDPNDRLGRNTGLTLARADVFRGATSLTFAGAGADRLLAARLRTVVRGVEVAVIASAARHRRPAYGGNVTHVVGQRLEWHAELLAHERAQGAGRTFSAIAGVQYTVGASANFVLEYHRNGRGLDDGEWTALTRGGRPGGTSRAPGSLPGRRQFLFARAARAGGSATLAPELIVVAGLDDGAWTFVPGVTWTPRRHVQIYARAVYLAGGTRSVAAFAPWSSSVTLGMAVRF